MNIKSEKISDGSYRNIENAEPKDLYKVLIGALAGAAVGSLAGGFFTEKGMELRSRVGKGSKNMTRNLKDKVSDTSEVVADKYEAAKEGAANLIEKGKEKIGMSPQSNAYSNNTTYTDTTEADKSGSGAQILLGALIVSVAGTIVWSFATEKGSETRRRVARESKEMAGNFKEKVTDAASGIKDGLSDVYEAAKEGAADLLEQEKQKLKTS